MNHPLKLRRDGQTKNVLVVVLLSFSLSSSLLFHNVNGFGFTTLSHRNSNSNRYSNRYSNSNSNSNSNRLDHSTFIRKGTHLYSTTSASASTSQTTDVNVNVNANVNDDNENNNNKEKNVQVSFSHVHLYTDALEDVQIYKQLEEEVTSFVNDYDTNTNVDDTCTTMDIQHGRNIWNSIKGTTMTTTGTTNVQEEFVPQGRDVVKQLISGLGLRVTGTKYIPNVSRNIVLTTKDPYGVQFVISALDNDGNDSNDGIDGSDGNDSIDSNDDKNGQEYCHFDPENIHQFYKCHSDRQGIAVLAFSVTSGTIENIYQRYLDVHPNLVTDDYKSGIKMYYKDNGSDSDSGMDSGMDSDNDSDSDGSCEKVLEVYSYYQNEKGGEVDKGTKLRFVQQVSAVSTVSSNNNDDDDDNNTEKKMNTSVNHIGLPGMVPIDATFDETCMAAYCDHWVSNVVSRTGFIETLEETLGFTPKVDFNAGVVAAGEAQIESTVTGNESKSIFEERGEALRDQSQVYLPINNALSEVGHVHGFIEEIGQGIQHIASRVDDLPAFVQRGNDFRKITGEGLTFLKIPRSYYGILSLDYLMNEVKELSSECAAAVLCACEVSPGMISNEGAICLDLQSEELLIQLQTSISAEAKEEFDANQDDIVNAILRSRYSNLYNLLGDNLSTDTYMAIVKNQILVDVQGNDLLFQIFTSNILQRKPGDESPFLEFIQRVCSSGGSGEDSSTSSCPVEMKAGCGGFGIRNFLTLFLSIEVGKAMLDVSQAKEKGDVDALTLAEKKVSIFTEQLNEANPILTAISDAMTEEGNALNNMEDALRKGDMEAVELYRQQMETAMIEKNASNEKLMACSSKYNNLMKSLKTVDAI